MFSRENAVKFRGVELFSRENTIEARGSVLFSRENNSKVRGSMTIPPENTMEMSDAIRVRSYIFQRFQYFLFREIVYSAKIMYTYIGIFTQA